MYISCLRAFVPTCAYFSRACVLTYLQRLTKYTEAHFYTLYCCFSLDYLTFHSIQNPQTNSLFYNCIPQSHLVEYCYVGYCYLLVGYLRPNPQETADLVTFTEEILNGKLHFLCSVACTETVI